MRAEDIRLTLNRSAIVVKPKQPFLDWLHEADSTSSDLTLGELALEPAIYLSPNATHLRKSRMYCTNCARRSLSSSWRVGSTTQLLGLQTVVSMSSVAGSTISTIPC